MKRIASVFLAALFSLALVGCGPSEPTTKPVEAAPFKIAFNTWIGYSPLVIAKEKGFLKARGIDAEISFLEGIGEKNSALLRGDIDGVGHTADSAVTSAASGVDGQIVYVFDESYGADGILVGKGIDTVEQLKGKQVALEPGFTGHFFFLTLLEDAGMKPADVTITPMDTGSAGSAFVAGKVDAAVTWEPWIGKVKERSDGHVLVTSKDKPGRIIDVLYMNRSTIDKRTADVDKLIDAMNEATVWYGAHKDEGDELIAKFWKLSLPEAKDTVSGMRFFDGARNKEFFGTAAQPGELLKTVESANRVWADAKVISAPISDPARLIRFYSPSTP